MKQNKSITNNCFVHYIKKIHDDITNNKYFLIYHYFTPWEFLKQNKLYFIFCDQLWFEYFICGFIKKNIIHDSMPWDY